MPCGIVARPVRDTRNSILRALRRANALFEGAWWRTLIRSLRSYLRKSLEAIYPLPAQSFARPRRSLPRMRFAEYRGKDCLELLETALARA